MKNVSFYRFHNKDISEHKTIAGKRAVLAIKIENWFSARFTHVGANKKYV